MSTLTPPHQGSGDIRSGGSDPHNAYPAGMTYIQADVHTSDSEYDGVSDRDGAHLLAFRKKEADPDLHRVVGPTSDSPSRLSSRPALGLPPDSNLEQETALTTSAIAAPRHRPEVTQRQRRENPDPAAILTYTDGPTGTEPPDYFLGGGGAGEGEGGGGGGGGRLRNRAGVSTTSRYMPTIAERDWADGADTPASHASFSNNNSYSTTGNYSNYGPGVGVKGGVRGGRVGEAGTDILTVEGAWKVDKAMKAQHKRKSSKVRLLAVAKWVMTMLMAAALLCCLVCVKLSVLVLSSQLWEQLPQGGEENEQEQWRRYSAQFIVLYIYLSVPPLLMLVRALWRGLLDRTVPWPGRKGVILAVINAGLESVGLCLMCYSVLGRYQSPLAVLLMASLLMLPAFNNVLVVRQMRSIGRLRFRTAVSVMLGAVLLGLGLVGTGLVLFEADNVDLWHVVAAVACLSLAWLPSWQHYISTASHSKPHRGGLTGGSATNSQIYGTFDSNHTGPSDGDMTITTTTNTITTTTTSSASNNTTSSTSTRQARTVSGDLSCNAAWKTSFIVNACRVFFIFLVSCLLFILDTGTGGPGDVLTETVHQAFLDAWDLASSVESSATWTAFWAGLATGAAAYFLAFSACHMNMATGALAPPLLLAMPLTLVAVTVRPVCEGLLPEGACQWEESKVAYVAATAACLFLGHVLAFGWYLFRVDPLLLQQESLVFCVPGYHNMAMDTWLTLNRRHDVSVSVTADKKSWTRSKVYICTTMYREDEDEMRQLLESIRLVNEAQAGGDRYFESHIIFDNGVRQKELSEFALTLIGLLEETLGIFPKACTKVTTPYGLKLSWALPGPSGQRMAFNIHLKDNFLVKNKKRWSQVMYMSYVLDFLTDVDDDAFILTTDADVVFTPDSVEALMDLMTRDNSIGAVCARTHPMGGGPLVWYQIFEYAIGHWFQKTAEHVLGSVLCAPGCFSVYRCKALADVLPKYAKRVETAFDFLTKDMGEDRWLCTLLVQSGWRIEYCAASENRTNCPGYFDEFYKQRRRWIASTLANLMLIVKEWKYVHQLNHRVSVIFLVYQGLLLFSTLIGPSTVVLVVSGGLTYAWNANSVAAVVAQLLGCIIFAIICIYTTQNTQLVVAKLYTFIYAIVMTAVVVGTAEQIVNDLDSESSTPNDTSITTTVAPNQHISVDLPVSVTSLYFMSLVGIFVSAGFLHPREIYCLMYGVFYLLCLPSGYLVLTIYSVCNITDSSWEVVPEVSVWYRDREATQKSSVKNQPWQMRVQDWFFDIFFCCKRPTTTKSTTEAEIQTVTARTHSVSISLPDDSRPSSPVVVHDDGARASAAAELEASHEEMDEFPDDKGPVPVEEWLPLEMRGRYTHLFKKHGFDSTLFIAGMNETELRRIGVTSKGHMHFLLAQIALIPAFEIEYKVPTNVDEWLVEIGLDMYRDNFRRNHIRKPKEMEILKSFGRKEIERELGIVKDGHIKRMMYAISMLRDPTEAQQKAIRMRQIIDDAPMHQLGEFNVGESDFWETLKVRCLKPDLKAFGLEEEVKVKLAYLRNEWLMILAVSNTLWLILISTLASKSALTVLGANPLGLIFLVVFGFLFVLQFMAMLLHRLYTLSHYLARAPYRCGKPMKSSWAFSSQGLAQSDYDDTLDFTAMQQVKRDAQRAWERMLKPKRGRVRVSRAEEAGTGEQSEEKTPLMV